MNQLARPHVPVVAVVAVVVFAALCIIGMLISFPPSLTPGQNGTTSSSLSSGTDTSSAASSTTSGSQLAGYNFAAVSENDTVILLNSGVEPVVINLDRRSWRQPRWSPDGNFLAVLGKAGTRTNNYDIYIFEVASSSWRQATILAPAASGVSSFAWRGDGFIAFTQGTGANAWLHVYDYGNNEVRKVFQVEGQIAAVDSLAQHYIIQRGQEYQLRGFGGDILATSAGQPVQNPVFGRRQGEYIAQSTGTTSAASMLWYPNTGEVKSLVRNATAPQGVDPLPLKAYCALPANGLLVSLPQTSPSTLELGAFVPEQNDYRQIFAWASDNSATQAVGVVQSLCRESTVALQIQETDTAGKVTRGWYTVTGTTAQKIVGADSYQQMALK